MHREQFGSGLGSLLVRWQPSEPESSEAERHRLTEIYRRWSEMPRQPLGVVWWNNLVNDNPEFVIAALGLGFSNLFDPIDLGVWRPISQGTGLWMIEVEPVGVEALQRIPGAFVMTALVLIWLADAWVIDHWLTQGTKLDESLPRWLRCLRFLFCGLPVLGISVLHLWPKVRELMPRGRPDRLCLSQTATWAARRGGGFLSRSAKRMATPRRVAVLLLVGYGVFFVAGSRFALPREPTPGHWLTLVLISLTLHGVAFVAMVAWLLSYSRQTRRSTWHTLFLVSLAIFWLLPIPHLAALLAAAFPLLHDRRPETLVRAGFEGRRTLNRHPIWQTLVATMRQLWSRVPGWRRWRRPQNLDVPAQLSRPHVEIRRLCRRRCLALAFESALLVVILGFISRVEPGLESVLNHFLRVFLIASLILGTVSLLLIFVRFVGFVTRSAMRSPAFDPYAWLPILAMSQLAVAAGIHVGSALYRGAVKEIGLKLALCGVLGLALQSGPIFLRYLISVPFSRRMELREVLPWACLFAAFFVAGSSMAKDEAVALVYLPLVLSVTLLSPLWGALTGVHGLGWLLHPFGVRHIFDRRLPVHLRAELLGLVLTGVAPFGGWASPWWIFARVRRSAHEKQWLEDGSSFMAVKPENAPRPLDHGSLYPEG